MTKKQLVRPEKGRMLFGVAAGIANYFEIDPAIVRLIFVLLAIGGGAGVLIYLIGIFVIPSEKEVDTNKEIKEKVQSVAYEIKTATKDKNINWRGEQIFGFILVVIGFMLLSQMFWPWFNVWRFWPLVIVVFGAILLARSGKEIK